MPLNYLMIKNFSRVGYTPQHTTELYQADGSTINELMLPRAARLQIELMPNLPTELDGYGTGYYSICTQDLTISGYAGGNGLYWAGFSAPPTIDATNPLYLTPYIVPESYGVLPGYPYVGDMPEYDYRPPTGLYGGPMNLAFANDPFKWFSEEQVKIEGHQDIAAYIDANGTNNLAPYSPGAWDWDNAMNFGNYMNTVTGYPEVWIDNLGTLYIDPEHTARKMWTPAVHRVIMFDTVGTETVYDPVLNAYKQVGLQGNKVDIFVVLKDSTHQDYDEDSETYFVLGTHTSSTSGVTIDGLLNSDGISLFDAEGYEQGVGIIPVDLDGGPSFVKGQEVQSRMPAVVSGEVLLENPSTTTNSSFVIKDIYKNPYQPSKAWTIKEKTYNKFELEQDTDFSIDRWILSGPCYPGGGKKTIAKVEISADENYYISKKPIIKTNNNNVSLSFTKTNKQGGRPVKYFIDIMYESYSTSKDSKIEFIYSTKLIPVSAAHKIDRIEVEGDDRLSHKGEERTIKVIGTPGTPFGITVNDSTGGVADEIIASGETSIFEDVEEYYKISHASDVSILGNAAIHRDYFFGNKMKVLKGVIPNNGIYKFKQTFPSNVGGIAKKLSGSGAGPYTMDTVRGILEDDIIISSKNNNLVQYHEVQSVNSASNQVTFKTHPTLVTNEYYNFVRKKYYSVNIVPSLTPNFDTSVNDSRSQTSGYNTSSIVLVQQAPIQMTINWIVSRLASSAAITHLNGVSTGPLSQDVTLEQPLTINRGDTIAGVIKLDLVNNAHVWSSMNRFKLDSDIPGGFTSNFNTLPDYYIPENNGGTSLRFSKLEAVQTLPQTNIVDLRFEIKILEIGHKSFDLNVYINRIFNQN